MKHLLRLALFSILWAGVLSSPVSPQTQQNTPSSPSKASKAEDTPAQTKAPGKSSSETQAVSQKDTSQNNKDDVVKISVTLVQVDAVVTDGNGKHVADLKPEDFEIFEDGKPQHITNFSFVSATAPRLAPLDKNAPPLAQLRPGQVRRTLALVVDDLGLSFESTAHLHVALKKFVDEQIEPGDLVAIIRTGSGMGALQQFTSDRRVLHAAIDRIRWNALGRGGLSPFPAIEPDYLHLGADPRGFSGLGALVEPGDREALDRFHAELFTVGTLGAMTFVVRSMRELPGRKSMILFSEGFRIFDTNLPTVNDRVYDAVRSLTDLANRSSVVIYTVDPRGLQTAGLTAADNTAGIDGSRIHNSIQQRHNQFFESLEGLNYLSGQTGGFTVHDTNDLNLGIRRVLDDQLGYYLLGYVPEESSFRPSGGFTRFHKIKVNLRRAGLHVRSRTGFYGVSDDAVRAARAGGPDQQLLGALVSPFSGGDIGLRLTSVFGHDAKAGSFMRSLLHIDPTQLTFTKGDDGQHTATIQVAAFTFGDNDQIIDHESQEYAIHAADKTFDDFLRDGMLYSMIVHIKKPGAYQLRVAVRDSASGKTGSATQFIEVPDIRKKRLALSGIVVSGNKPENPIRQVGTASSSSGGSREDDIASGPSVRRLRPDMSLTYAFVIYNPTVDSKTKRPAVQGQVKLWRDGKAVYTGKPAALDIGALPDLRQIPVTGRFSLNQPLEPGDYVLQVIITDPLAKDKYRTATQWIDFEVER